MTEKLTRNEIQSLLEDIGRVEAQYSLYDIVDVSQMVLKTNKVKALCNMALSWLEVQPKGGPSFVDKPYNADKGEQTTICDVCGNANLAHDKAKWSEDGSSFCPPCFPQSFSPSLPEPK